MKNENNRPCSPSQRSGDRVTLTQISRCAQGFLEFLEEELDILFRCQRSHHSNAEDLASQRSKAAGDFNARSIDEMFAYFRLIHSFRDAYRGQSRDPVLLRNM